MANLYATFCRAFPNVYAGQAGDIIVGAGCRTETVAVPGSGTLTAGNGEIAVLLLADADCWVAVGPSPDTGADTDGVRAAFPLVSGVALPVLVQAGDSVAVETR
jgi:hypothetical protein